MASSAITSGISSGKKSFAPSNRRTPRECGSVLSSQSAHFTSKVESAVPQTILAGDGHSRRADSIAMRGLFAKDAAKPMLLRRRLHLLRTVYDSQYVCSKFVVIYSAVTARCR